jgi:excisionase family DNA binding protein
MINKLLKGTDVAEILNVSRAFAYRMMAEGRIPVVKLGRSVRVRPEDLQTFVTESVPPKPDLLFPAPVDMNESRIHNL